MRVQDRANRLNAIDAPRSSSNPVHSSLVTQSAPTSRNNSSSSEGSGDDSFQSQMERALVASVEVASAQVVTSTVTSPLDEATRRAIAESLDEAIHTALATTPISSTTTTTASRRCPSAPARRVTRSATALTLVKR